MIKYMVTAMLLLALAAVFIFQQSETRELQQKIPRWTAIEAIDVTTINITVAKNTPIELHRVTNGWQLKDQSMANTEAVDQLLNNLSDMHPVRVVTRKHKHDKSLRLDPQGTHLLLLDASGQKIFDAMIGKQGANLLSTYLRLQGSDSVLAVNQSLNWQLQRSLNDWKKVVPPTAKTITVAP